MLGRKQWRAFGAAPIAGVLLLSACTVGTSGKADGTSTKKTLTVALSNFRSDTALPTRNTRDGLFYYAEIYDFLVGVDDAGKPSKKTGVATDWTSSSDNKAWDFTLRKGVKWHDGSKLTANDVAYSLDLYSQDASTCSTCSFVATNLDKATATDDYTVHIDLKNPVPFLPNMLSPLDDLPILPKAYLEKVGPDGFAKAPMGSGPYKFVSHTTGQEWSFEANPDYWDKSRIPSISRLKFVLTPEGTSRLAELDTGHADIVQLDPDQVPQAKSKATVMGPSNAEQTYLIFGQSYKPNLETHGEALRKAIALSINMDELIQAIYPGGSATRATGYGDSPLRAGHIDLEPYPYDPDQAKQILQANGLAGTTVDIYSFTLSGMSEAPQVLNVVAGFLSKVGLKTRIKQVEYATLRPKVLAGELGPPGFIQGGFAVTSDDLASVLRISMVSHDAGGITAGYWDPATLDPMFKQLSAATTNDQAEDIAKQINQTIHDTYATLPIANVNSEWAVSKDVTNWKPTNNTPYILNWWSVRV